MLGVNANKAKYLLIYHKVNHWPYLKVYGSIMFLLFLLSKSVFGIRDNVLISELYDMV